MIIVISNYELPKMPKAKILVITNKYNESVKQNKLYNIKNKDDYKSKRKEYNLPYNPEEEFRIIWKNWYDYLDIKTDIYPSKFKDFKYLLEKNNINSLEAYKENTKNLNLPEMPEELYPEYSNMTVLFNKVPIFI